jgi:hypothetical protein
MILITAALFHPEHPISPLVLIGGSIFVLGVGTQVIARYKRRGQEQRRSSNESAHEQVQCNEEPRTILDRSVE